MEIVVVSGRRGRPLNVELIAARIKTRCQEIGMSEKVAAKKAGLGTSYVTDLRYSKSSHPEVDKLQRLAEVLGVRLAYLLGTDEDASATIMGGALGMVPEVGFVEAGAFRKMDTLLSEASEHEYPLHSVPMSNNYPKSRHFIVRVRGDSMNAARGPSGLAPIVEGMLAVCLDIADAGVPVETGNIYVVQRTMDSGSTYEYTLKRARVYRDRIELLPESTNPDHEKFTIPTNHDPIDGIRIEAVGLLIGTYSTFER